MGADDALSGDFLGALFGLVAGFMIYVVVYELFPEAFASSSKPPEDVQATSLVAKHIVSHAFVGGCAVMLVSIAFMTPPEGRRLAAFPLLLRP